MYSQTAHRVGSGARLLPLFGPGDPEFLELATKDCGIGMVELGVNHCCLMPGLDGGTGVVHLVHLAELVEELSLAGQIPVLLKAPERRLAVFNTA